MTRQRAVFLDLQGTLGGEGLGDILDFAFYPFTAPAVRQLSDAGLRVIVVTNQSRIAKGRFTLDYFNRRMEELQAELQASGATWDSVYCCPHSSTENCACKKPAIGMLLQAQRDFDLDLKRCYVVGDTGLWDMVLAHDAGCKGVLVRTGNGESSLNEFRHTWPNV